MSVSAATVAHLQHTAPRAGGAGALSWGAGRCRCVSAMLMCETSDKNELRLCAGAIRWACSIALCPSRSLCDFFFAVISQRRSHCNHENGWTRAVRGEAFVTDGLGFPWAP